MEVVEAEQLHLDLARLGDGRGGEEQEGDEGGEQEAQVHGPEHSRFHEKGVTVVSRPGGLFSAYVSSQRDLFANFDRMRREIDELFGDVFERQTGLRGRGFSPSVDVYYTDDPPRAVVKTDLSGIDIADVALEIRGRQLLITGERRPNEAAGRLYQQIEIEHGPFRRLVELGADVVAEAARASYEDGILEVEIPLARLEQGVRRVPIEEG